MRVTLGYNTLTDVKLFTRLFSSISSVCISAILLGDIRAAAAADLEQVRQMVNKMQEEKSTDLENTTKLSSDWCFVDCKFISNETKFSNLYRKMIYL